MCEYVTLSTKPEVHNTSESRQKRTEPRAARGNVHKNGDVFRVMRANKQANKQTNKQTDKQTYSSQYFATFPGSSVATGEVGDASLLVSRTGFGLHPNPTKSW